MTQLRLDRLLETSSKQKNDAVLIVGAPPLLRSEWGLRPALLPALRIEDIGSILAEMAPPPGNVHSITGISNFDIEYGDCMFRVAAFGNPPELVLLTRLSADAPRLDALQSASEASGPSMRWDRILANCVKRGLRDVLLVPGYPPLLWSRWGIHAFLVPPLSGKNVIAMVDEIMQPPGLTEDKDGYKGFDVQYGFDGEETFRAAVFGYPSPTFVALMRLPISDKVRSTPVAHGGESPSVGGAAADSRSVSATGLIT